jgi:TRAP-type C4-dicarboxylate transport system permease small subunit
MTAWMKKLSQLAKNVMTGVNTIAGYLTIIMTVTVTVEVISRYVFSHPTTWVWPINRQLFGIFILVALAYTQSKGGHIRIEIFYDRFPPVIKKFFRWFSLIVMLSFIGVLTWQTSIMAINAIEAHERASGAFKIPLYPFKTLIPLMAFVIAIQIILSFFAKKEKPSKKEP